MNTSENITEKHFYKTVCLLVAQLYTLHKQIARNYIPFAPHKCKSDFQGNYFIGSIRYCLIMHRCKLIDVIL